MAWRRYKRRASAALANRAALASWPGAPSETCRRCAIRATVLLRVSSADDDGRAMMQAMLELDAGEHDDETEELWALAEMLNVACGGHAGDERSMARLAAFCAHAGKRLAAHPSYPDRDGFGRRSMRMEPDALRLAVREQCGALRAIAERAGIAVTAVKPHGALYHDAAANPAIAAEILDGAVEALGTVLVVGRPRGALYDAALARGLRYAREGFADRRMRGDGSLVPRSEPDALITDPTAAAAQAVALDADAICVHADTPGAAAIARAVRDALVQRADAKTVPRG